MADPGVPVTDLPLGQDPNVWADPPASFDWTTAANIIQFDLASGAPDNIANDLNAQLGWSPTGLNGDWQSVADIINFSVAGGANQGAIIQSLQDQLQGPPALVDPATGAPVPGVAGGLTDVQKSAKATLNDTLSQFGLDTLGTFVWNEYLNGVPIEQVMLDIRGTPEYQARFPAMKTLAQQGQAMSEAAYISYEKQIKNIEVAAGMPQEFIDNKDAVTGFLEKGMSAQEVGQRVQDWLNFANTAPTVNQAELQRLYGVDAGGIAAYFLDPQKALPLLEKQMNATLTATQSLQAGYGDLSKQQAEYVAGLGIKPQETLKGFQQAVQENQLFNPLPGQAGPSFNTDQQVQAIFGGNQQTLTELENIARQRVANNEGDYNYLADQKGSGVGGAQVT